VKRIAQISYAIARGIALDQTARRRAMFILTIISLLMVFIGAVPLWPVFVEHPLFFAIYWLICAWLTVCVILLAIYDLIIVRKRHRQELEAVRKDLFRDP